MTRKEGKRSSERRCGGYGENKNDEMASYKLPPQNIEAEQSILGGILIDNHAIDTVSEIISSDDFYRESHKKIFDCMASLLNASQPCDLITLTDLLKKREILDEVGGIPYIAYLTDSIPTAANIKVYARIVKEKSVLRKLISVGTDIVSRCYEPDEELAEFLDHAEKEIFEISEDKSRESYSPMKDIVVKSFKRIEKLFDSKDMFTGVSTGFVELDKLTSGLQPSDLIIVAGRPSMGKTAFCMNIAQHAAIEAKVPVAVFSLEMSKDSLGMRLLSSEARIEQSRFRGGFHLSDIEWARLTRAAGYLSEAPIYIDDTPSISIMAMRAKARRIKAAHGLGMIIVDYLQLMRGSTKAAERREQEISEISRGLKALAKELDVPVVALSQLNRATESRSKDDRRPQLSDLRESGAIEQDADVIMFIYRDEVYNKSEDNPNKGIAEIIIGKQRNGPTDTVRLAFLNKFTLFENLAQG